MFNPRSQHRRDLLKLISAFAGGVSGELLAQDSTSQFGDASNSNTGVSKDAPYFEVKPIYKLDDHTVRIFFSPDCQFSRQYLKLFKNLNNTLLEQTNKIVIFNPLLDAKTGYMYGMAFGAVQRFFPPYMQQFMEASMIAVQEKSVDVNNIKAIEYIARATGFGRAKDLPVSLPQYMARNFRLLHDEAKSYHLAQKSMNVLATPSVTVDGKYLVTPDITNGDPSAFSNLLNALISKSIG